MAGAPSGDLEIGAVNRDRAAQRGPRGATLPRVHETMKNEFGPFKLVSDLSGKYSPPRALVGTFLFRRYSGSIKTFHFQFLVTNH